MTARSMTGRATTTHSEGTNEKLMKNNFVCARTRGRAPGIVAPSLSHLLQTFFGEFSRIDCAYRGAALISGYWGWPAVRRATVPSRGSGKRPRMSWQNRCYVASLARRRSIRRRFSRFIAIFCDRPAISGLRVALGNAILIAF